jgi:hypothetical protein
MQKNKCKDINAPFDSLPSRFRLPVLPTILRLFPKIPKKTARRPKDERIVSVERVKCPAIQPPPPV